ncbi:NUMOD3 domain-containing DNA-binding protein [Clostridium perfringens]|uniref:NUMOD3 domain-containing DNA-binding protein n=2 Tax=Clostridium perfringens TaxID=1502 RepID=UPI0032DBE7BC
MKRYGVIYKIINKINGKVYIGQTTKSFNERYPMSGVGIERVYKYHDYHRRLNCYYNQHLHSAIKKYGFDSFDVIEEFDIAYSKESLDYLEDYYIRIYKSNINKFGYNNKEGGANGKLSEESIEKMIRTKKKAISKLTKEQRWNRFARVGKDNPNFGKKRSEITRKKISEGNKGKIISKEQKKQISDTLKGKYTRGKSPNARKVICITTYKVFNCIKDGADYYGCERRNISYCCNGKLQSCGKHPLTKEKLVWKYYDEYLKEIG